MWVNHRLLTAVQSLSDDELRRSFSIGQESVWRTLTHLFAAENVWLEALLGNESFRVPGDVPGKLPGNQEGEGAIATLRELVLKWNELDRRWNVYLERLSESALDDVVYRTSSSSARQRDLEPNVPTYCFTCARMPSTPRRNSITCCVNWGRALHPMSCSSPSPGKNPPHLRTASSSFTYPTRPTPEGNSSREEDSLRQKESIMAGKDWLSRYALRS